MSTSRQFVIGMFIETSAAITLAPILVPVAQHFASTRCTFGLIMQGVNLAPAGSSSPPGVNLLVACTVARISLDRVRSRT